MPKRTLDDEMPRRAGRGAKAATPGLLMRMVMYSPKDFAAGFIAFGAICAIVSNAIFMQAGQHPSPWFGTPSFTNATAPAIPNPLPRPRPLDAVQPSERALDSRLFDGKPADIRAQPKADVKPDAPAAPRVEAAPAPRVEVAPAPRVESKPERTEARHAPRHVDPMAGLIRNASAARPAPAVTPVAAPIVASNPNIPRPPASVPTRGDPLADLISGRGR